MIWIEWRVIMDHSVYSNFLWFLQCRILKYLLFSTTSSLVWLNRILVLSQITFEIHLSLAIFDFQLLSNFSNNFPSFLANQFKLLPLVSFPLSSFRQTISLRLNSSFIRLLRGKRCCRICVHKCFGEPFGLKFEQRFMNIPTWTPYNNLKDITNAR